MLETKLKKPIYPSEKDMKIFVKYLIKQEKISQRKQGSLYNKKDSSYRDSQENCVFDPDKWFLYFP